MKIKGHCIGKRRVLGTTILASLAPFSAPVGAQTQPDVTALQEVEVVMVTGSRIKRAQTTTEAPITMLDPQALVDRGFVQAGQALNELTANMPQFSLAAGDGTDSGNGQQFPNLFGLGAGRTLTLVNGRRFVTSSAGLGDRVVDTNIIPTGLIERVDVVQAGGAAVYGSDAIAGVVNYVLKDNLTGLELDAQYGRSSRDDYPVASARATAGRNFFDERANIAVNIEWSKTEPLYDYDRPRTNLGRVTLSNEANTSTSDGIPAVRENFNTRLTTFNANGLLFTVPAPVPNFIVRAPNSTTPLQFDGAGTALIPYDPGLVGSVPFSSGGDGLPYQELATLYTGVERASGTVLGHIDLTDRIKLSGEFLYARVESRDPFQNQADKTVLNSAASGAGPIPILRDNPYLSPEVRAVLGAGPPLFLSKWFTDLLPTREGTLQTDTARALLALEGDFDLGSHNFYWSLAASHGETDGEQRGWGVWTSRFNNAVNAVRNGSGTIVCAINADANPANDDPSCAPLNPFGVGNVSAEARDYTTVLVGQDYRNTQDDYLATLGGDLFSLPAGKVNFSVAYEHREEQASFDPLDANLRGLVGSQVPTLATRGAYNTEEISGELLVPVLGDEFSFPGAQRVEVNGSYRYVDNSIAGTEDVWGLGLRWQVVEDLSLRASRSRNFRAPTLDQVFAPQRAELAPIRLDPCDADRIAGGPAPATRRANCEALFAANPGYGPLATFQDPAENFNRTLVTTGGNPDLRNEISKTWTYGFVFQPRFVPGLTLIADRVEVDLTDGLSAFLPQNFLETCYDSPNQPADICSTFTRDAAGVIDTARQTTFNAGRITFRGQVYSANYAFELGRLFSDRELGELELNFEATQIDRLEFSVTGFDLTRVDNTASTAGYGPSPDLAAKFDLRYHIGPFHTTYTMNYLSSVKPNATATIETTPTPKIDANVRHNIFASYDFGNLTMRGGISNFTDEEPSYPTRNYGDILGRQYYVGFGARF